MSHKRIRVRQATGNDLDALAALESESFKEVYPRFFFRQVHDLSAETLLVAYDGDRAAGYIVALPEAKCQQIWWILSIAVEPRQQGQGVGAQLTKSLLRVLCELGATTVKLTVDPRNAAACSLYKRFGFQDREAVYNYFGSGEHRQVMEKRLNSMQQEPNFTPSHLLAETNTSVSFSSILFAVTAAIVLFVAQHQRAVEFVVPLGLATLSAMAALYSGLFYANASGGLSRITDPDSASRPLIFGNAVSEYLGLFPLVGSIPLFLLHLTESFEITVIATVLNFITFIGYQLSGYDILSRVVARWTLHSVITAGLVGLMLSMLVAEWMGNDLLAKMLAGVFVIANIALTFVTVVRLERRAPAW